MKSKEKLITNFISFATQYGDFVLEGNNRKVNEMHKKLHHLYNVAIKEGDSNIFQEFLDSDNESVRLWAAVFSLKSSPIVSEAVLRKLSTLKSITGLTAKSVLHLWKEGKLELL